MNMEECIQHISAWYFSDTIELLDLVLCDDEEDPQYSAITTMNRLWIYIQYQKKLNKDCEYDSVASLILKSGYSSEDVALFKKKVLEERDIYHGTILDEEFF